MTRTTWSPTVFAERYSTPLEDRVKYPPMEKDCEEPEPPDVCIPGRYWQAYAAGYVRIGTGVSESVQGWTAWQAVALPG